MAKVTTTYVCSECGTQSPVQMGKCPRCGAWGSMEAKLERPSGGAAGARTSYSAPYSATVQRLTEVESTDTLRSPSGLDEVDRVLGGGGVAGAVLWFFLCMTLASHEHERAQLQAQRQEART